MIGYFLRNLAHYVHGIFYRVDRLYSTYRLIMRAAWWRVELGTHCGAHGPVFFNRRQDSIIRIGNGCFFSSRPNSNSMGLFCPCIFTTTEKNASILIGENCGFSGVRIRAANSVTVRNNVRCGANVLITDTDAHSDDPRAGKNAPVVIDDNVWLGMNVIVLKGVHIGENSLIGAGSVVTKDIPANVMAAGVPCRVIKELKL